MHKWSFFIPDNDEYSKGCLLSIKIQLSGYMSRWKLCDAKKTKRWKLIQIL